MWFSNLFFHIRHSKDNLFPLASAGYTIYMGKFFTPYPNLVPNDLHWHR